MDRVGAVSDCKIVAHLRSVTWSGKPSGWFRLVYATALRPGCWSRAFPFFDFAIAP